MGLPYFPVKEETVMYRLCFKRFFDILFSLMILLLFWWVLALIAVIVRVNLGSPVIFKQNRPGKAGKIFKLCKFRSMTDARDNEGNLLPDSQRLTKFGRLLRSSSLDELPEIWNILKGDMSFVGPRPWSVYYLKFFTEEENRRHEVRPGLTGYAQVNGRTAADWSERLRYDIKYVDELSIWLDIKIIFLTVKKVLSKSDIVDAEDQGDFDAFRKKQWEEGVVAKPAWVEDEALMEDHAE
jgi:lipopolysaccharide/colanic/teichoic acid biosynthesis glycosyltransferase